MNTENILSQNWLAMAPELIILTAAITIALLDLFLPKRFNRGYLGWIGSIAALISLLTLLNLPKGEMTILNDTFYLDSFARMMKGILLSGAILILALATSADKQKDYRDFSGEYYCLLLFAFMGGMVVTSSMDLLTLFVGLELVSVSSYILVGLKKRQSEANESALKYVINGGIATAMTLFGASFLYGLSGTTNLTDMAQTFSNFHTIDEIYLFVIASSAIIIGLSFKLATIPFSLWVPDVYQKAPTPVTAFLSVGSKIAGFTILARLTYSVFAAITAGGTTISLFLEMQNLLLAIAVLSMIFGNFMAIRQRDVKRLLAYSSIAHAGYLLAGLTSFSILALDAVIFYFFAYMLMTIGAFAVITFVAEKEREADVRNFSGLYKSSPFLAVSLGLFLLSMASIPGTAGFIGKVKIIISVLLVDPGQWLVAFIIIATTVLSYVYYFGLMIRIFQRKTEVSKDAKQNLRPYPVPLSFKAIIAVCVIGTVILGIVPGVVSGF